MKLGKMTVLSVLVLTGCRLGEQTPAPAPPPIPGGAIRTEPNVRIGLKVDTAAAVLSANTPVELLDRTGNTLARSHAGNQRWTFASEAAGSVTAHSDAGQRVSSTATPLRFRATGNGYVTIGDKLYRGEMLIQPASAGRVTVVNALEMEQYLLGVVPFEIGTPAGAVEAIKAQAIAARTYAIGNMGSRDALGFDFYATVADQVYGGASGEDTLVSRAVRETRGEILSYQGNPIIAYYSSTCGGQTAAVEESWPWRAPQPYLRSRSDRKPDGEGAYCETSNRYRWTVSWPHDSLRAILQQSLSERLRDPSLRITRVEDVRVLGRTQSGRVEGVAITADGVTYRVPADSIRWVLRVDRTRGLNSSLLFEVNANKSGGMIERLEVHGGGWGHGVGMCQVGAIGRARAGQNYREILSAYYSGTEITRLY